MNGGCNREAGSGDPTRDGNSQACSWQMTLTQSWVSVRKTWGERLTDVLAYSSVKTASGWSLSDTTRGIVAKQIYRSSSGPWLWM